VRLWPETMYIYPELYASESTENNDARHNATIPNRCLMMALDSGVVATILVTYGMFTNQPSTHRHVFISLVGRPKLRSAPSLREQTKLI
jgi:hypothetical protein